MTTAFAGWPTERRTRPAGDLHELAAIGVSILSTLAGASWLAAGVGGSGGVRRGGMPSR
jgi:hypothetical protein